METNPLLLQILVPTYGRPDSCIETIKSILELNDENIGISVSANGRYKKLEEFAQNKLFNSKHSYNYFENNVGAILNFKYLIENSRAKYVMLLSDEDRVIGTNLKNILEKLKQFHFENINVIRFSIYDMEKKNFYFKASPKMLAEQLSFNKFLSLSGVFPAYMSGVTFKRSSIKKEFLDFSFEPISFNAYPHLLLALKMINYNYIGYINEKFVIKGIDVKFGGDGYSHLRNTNNLIHETNLNLNPDIYGPLARIEQFKYNMFKISSMSETRKIPKYIYIMNLIIGYSGHFIDSFTVVSNQNEKLILKNIKEKYKSINLAFSNESNLIFKIFLLMCINKYNIQNLLSFIWNAFQTLLKILFIYGLNYTFLRILAKINIKGKYDFRK